MSRTVNPYLIADLLLWGAWRRGEVRGLEPLTYPSLTPDARLYTSPGRGSLPCLTPAYLSDKRAVWVDKRILQITAKLQIALWCNYVQCLPEDKSAIITDVEDYRQALESAEKAAAKAMNMRYYIWSGSRQRKREIGA